MAKVAMGHTPPRILVACEYSGVVRDAFSSRGWDTWSADLLESDTPGNHHWGDWREMRRQKWDLVVAHPPCTYLCASGMHWTTRGLRDPQLTEDAAGFFMEFTKLDCAWAVENPIGCMSKRFRKPDQIIQPYQFGHDASKSTCLWLSGLPKLEPTKLVPGRMMCCGNYLETRKCPTCSGKKKPLKRWANQTPGGLNNLPPGPDRWKIRARTYQGIGQAMADQWGAYLEKKL